MLLKASKLNHMNFMAIDGEFGKIDQLYFDDQQWTIRYFVVKTGGLLTRKDVLISPIAIKSIDLLHNTVHVNLTKKQIEESPDIDTEKPVSRQHEKAYYAYFNWPTYWGDDRIDPWLIGPYGIHWKYFSDLYLPDKNKNGESTLVETEALKNPNYIPSSEKPETESEPESEGHNAHLRATREVRSYHISALDGVFGHVEDFIIEGLSMIIRYLEIDTINWLPSKSVLISPKWLSGMSWQEKKVFVDFPKDIIRHAPSFSEKNLNRQYEEQLYAYYNHTPYWIEETLPSEEAPIHRPSVPAEQQGSSDSLKDLQ